MTEKPMDYAPTRVERELFEQACANLWSNEPLPRSELAAELVALGVPTIERAIVVIDAHFAPGDLRPLDEGGKPSLSRLIQRHASSMSTPDLLALILKHHPDVSIDAIQAELRRQAEANMAEADALQQELERRRSDKR